MPCSHQKLTEVLHLIDVQQKRTCLTLPWGEVSNRETGNKCDDNVKGSAEAENLATSLPEEQ